MGFRDPLTAPNEFAEMAAAGVSSFAMELIPRITREPTMSSSFSPSTVNSVPVRSLFSSHNGVGDLIVPAEPSEWNTAQSGVIPPSTNTSIPVIPLLSSKARKTIALAISSALASLAGGEWLGNIFNGEATRSRRECV